MPAWWTSSGSEDDAVEADKGSLVELILIESFIISGGSLEELIRVDH